MIRTNTMVMMKEFSLVWEVLVAVLTVLVVLIALVALAVSAALIAADTVAADIAVAEVIAVVVVVVVVAVAEVAAEADRISLGKKYCKPLHVNVEAILTEVKHKGQITVHRMIIKIM
jgi:hypothetical protein